MRLHSNVITLDLIVSALTKEQCDGRIANGVSFKILTEHRSTTHARAFEVQLTASQPGKGRRAGNSGSYGAGSEYAATYDEWGWLIAALYRVDPKAVWGSVKHPQYADADHFHDVTGLTYNPDRLLWHLNYGSKTIPLPAENDPYPYVTGRDTVGRRGAARKSADDVPAYAVGTWAKLQPRTAEWVRQFAAGQAF
jgi:uncharacterized protein YwbE